MNSVLLKEAVNALLAEYRGCHVLHVPNPGNAGDSLIAQGTYEAFERCDITYDLTDLNDDLTGQTVFIGGGGNLVPLYGDARAAIERCRFGGAKRIILLPHTVRGNEDLLQQLDDRCVLFCRDVVSYDHVRSVNPRIDARLAHDMAFHVDVPVLLNDSKIAETCLPIVRAKLAQVGMTEADIRSRPSLDFYRIGIEARSRHPETDADISLLFRLGVRPLEARLASWCFLHTINLTQHLSTDRLHVGIGAALLGKPCTLHDNSYGKNAAVAAHSLSGFPNLFSAKRVKMGTRTSLGKRSDLPYTIQVPLFNEKIILEFSKYYFDTIGISPHYVMDTQRTPECQALTRHLGIPPKFFGNGKPFIENGYEMFAGASPTDWILRLDCDEVPSLELLDACSDFVRSEIDGVAGFERHQVIWRDGKLHSARTPSFQPNHQRQWRLFNRTRVKYNRNIHTPGIHVERPVPFPPDACAYHVPWEFMSWEERVTKADRYEMHGQPAANRANQLLPLEDAEFAPLNAPLVEGIYMDWKARQKAV